jgi:hypothetical protein
LPASGRKPADKAGRQFRYAIFDFDQGHAAELMLVPAAVERKSRGRAGTAPLPRRVVGRNGIDRVHDLLRVRVNNSHANTGVSV